MSIPSYPKVYALGHAAIPDLLSDPVVVQEKVDGSQISFMLSRDGELHMRSKNATIYGDNPNDMFAAAVEVVDVIRGQLKPGLIYRGEYMRSPKHNALEYGRRPRNHIALYDIEEMPSCFLEREFLEREADRLGMEAVPQMYEGALSDMEHLDELMSRDSFLGGPIEGLVIKNYSRFTRDGKVMMGKHVSESFKETNKQSWKEKNPTKNDVLAVLVATYANEVRWLKAVHRLRDAGELEHSPRDIGALIKSAQADIEEECEEEIKDALWRHARSHILRGAVKGLPEWYKRQLAEDQFDSAAS